jgi:hypothetical protein
VTSKSQLPAGRLRQREFERLRCNLASQTGVFVRLRRALESNEELARKVDALETKYDGQFEEVFEAIRLLMKPQLANSRRIGY